MSSSPSIAVGRRALSHRPLHALDAFPDPDLDAALIRPFCIMNLYRYVLHYGLLLHIMSQYLCLFYLILQGFHKEGECRQLGFWLEKEQILETYSAQLQKS